MRYLNSAITLVALITLASGCRNPMPTFNPYGGFGSPTVAPPATGAVPAGTAPAQPGAFNSGIQQPTSVPVTTPTSGFQFQNQQPVGSGTTGWQATNSLSPHTNAAATAGAVNRATTPTVTNGTINETSFQGKGGATNTPSLLERIQQGRMPANDATAPAGAAAPVPGMPPAAPGYVPQQGVPAMTSVPGYQQLRGAGLALGHQAPAAQPNTNAAGHSVLVSNPPASQPAAAAPASQTTATSPDGLKWRSKQSPVLEVATR